MRRFVLLAAAVSLTAALALAAWGANPTVTPDDIGTSVRIPSVGRPVTYTVRLRAPADQAVAGAFGVAFAGGEASPCREPR